MELLEDIRFYKRNGKLPNDCIKEAYYQQGLFEETLSEEENNNEERIKIINYINNDIYVKNDYKSFVEELARNKRSAFLTPYTVNEFIKTKTRTYQVPGYEIGFALKPQDNGELDIVSVHNNTNIKELGEYLIDSAIRLGGTTLDHFDGFLSDFYKKKGFEEYDRYKWNNDYAPKNWDYDTYGTPDVILRRLKKK